MNSPSRRRREPPRGEPGGRPRGPVREGYPTRVLRGIVLAFLTTCGPAPPAESDAPLIVTGRFEEPPDGPFHAPVAVAVAGDRVWVADVGAKRVHLYDVDGRHRRTVGREGAGPGELVQPLAVAAAGDTAWVLDPGNRRIERFVADGAAPGGRALGDSIPPLVDMLRLEGRFYATTPFGGPPLVRLGHPGEPALRFGEELARAASESGGPGARGPDVYRVAVVDGRIWALHLYRPIFARYTSDGRLERLVRYPGPEVETSADVDEGPGRRVLRAPDAPAGALGVLELPGSVHLLTHQRAESGRQRLFRVPEVGEPRPVLAPPGVTFVGSASAGGRAFVVGARGQLDVPTVFMVERAETP